MWTTLEHISFTLFILIMENLMPRKLQCQLLILKGPGINMVLRDLGMFFQRNWPTWRIVQSKSQTQHWWGILLQVTSQVSELLKSSSLDIQVQLFSFSADCGPVLQKEIPLIKKKKNTVVPPLSVGNTFQDSQWIPKTVDRTALYIYVLSYTYISVIKFSL